MRIGYFADGPWSHEALKLIEQSPQFEIVFIVPRYDTQDPVLAECAKRLKVPFIPIDNVNDESNIEMLSQYTADLYVSMSFNQILKSDILKIAPKGFINCHAGALPFYRGRNPLNWVLINGESEFGITVHYVDEGIDTGDIILQKKYDISHNDNYGTLLKQAITSCADVLFEALCQLQHNTVKAFKQQDIHPVGTYFCQRKIGDELMKFEQTSVDVHNFVRAITLPGPCARCFIGDKEYAIVTSELIKDAPVYKATIGEVTGRTEKGVIVKTQDSTVLLTQMAEVNTNKLGSVFTPTFKVGTRFKLVR